MKIGTRRTTLHFSTRIGVAALAAIGLLVIQLDYTTKNVILFQTLLQSRIDQDTWVLNGGKGDTIKGTEHVSDVPSILADDPTSVLESVTTQREKSNNLNVTIVMRYSRNDRLGSNVQRPLNLMAYSYCKGYNFCAMSGRLGPAEIFGFPTCASNLKEHLPWVGTIFETAVNSSGMYSFQRNDGALLRSISENMDCAYSSSFRKIWREMILRNVSYYSDKHSVASQDLYGYDKHKDVVIVAVHIRRGDISSRHPIYISDVTYIATLRKLKDMLWKLGKRPSVHVFSEEYGDTNWTAYSSEGIVDRFHLAPQMNQQNRHAMDMELNLRDWKHFIQADILVVGGTFSRVASYARNDPDIATGLPLTITLCYDLPCSPSTQFDWSGVYAQFTKDRPEDVELVNLPVIFHPHDHVHSNASISNS